MTAIKSAFLLISNQTGRKSLLSSADANPFLAVIQRYFPDHSTPLHSFVIRLGLFRALHGIPLTELHCGTIHLVYLMTAHRSIFGYTPPKDTLIPIRDALLWQQDRDIFNEQIGRLRTTEQLHNSAISLLLDRENNKSPFEKTLHSLLTTCKCEEGTIWEYHANHTSEGISYLTLEASSGIPITAFTRNCLKQGEGLVSLALQPNAPKCQLRWDVTADDIANKEVAPKFVGKPVLILRLEVAGAIYGVACLAGVGVDIEVAATVLSTFENIVALEFHNKNTEYQCKVLEKIIDIVPQITQDITTVCEVAAQNLRDLINCQGASIFLKPELDTSSRVLRLYAAEIDSTCHQSEALAAFKGGKAVEYEIGISSLTGCVAASGKATICNEVSKSNKNSGIFREILEKDNDTWIGVPMHDNDNNCIGVIRCTGKQATIAGHTVPYVYGQFDLKVLKLFAKTLSPIFSSLAGAKELARINKQLARSEKIRAHEMTAPLDTIAANADFVLRYINEPSVTTKPRRLQEIIADTDMCAFLLKEPKVPAPEVFQRNLTLVSPRVMIVELVKFLRRQIERQSDLSESESASPYEMQYDIVPFMTVEFSANVRPIMAVRHLLQRAFYNLGINAIKYGLRNSRLTITMKESVSDDILYIEFSDMGIGIDEKDKPYLFTEGYRGVRVSQDEQTGQGLGLAIAKAIIEAHGGNIELKSAEKPTIFLITLPMKLPPPEAISEPQQSRILRMDRAKAFRK